MVITTNPDETPRNNNDGEYRLSPAYQEEQHSARWEDRYGDDDDRDYCDDWEDDGDE